jgi:hypothetical protein
MLTGWDVETKISKSFSKVPVAAILNSLVSEHPEYQWILDDGIINIAPRKTLGNRTSRIRAGFPAGSPLDRKIKKLDIVDTYLQDAVSNVICPAAELECPAPLLIPGGTPYAEPPRKVSLHLKNVTVRKALNALVRRDGHSMWHFWRGDDKTNEIAIYTFPAPKESARK